MKAKQIFVSGIVQGVFFRYYTKKTAELLGIKGYVKNRSDGRVEIIAIGDNEKINELTKWCKHGPEKAVVEEIIAENIEIDGTYNKFEIN